MTGEEKFGAKPTDSIAQLIWAAQVDAWNAAVAEERDLHLKFLLIAYDALIRSGWEPGLNDREAGDAIFNHLCNCDCDPNLSEKAKAIRRRPL